MGSSVALVLIDIQQLFHNAVKDTFPEFEKNIRSLISFARENKIEIIHIQAEYSQADSPWMEYTKTTSPSRDHSVQSDFCEFSKPEPHEKHCFDCFVGTEVEEYLKKTNKKDLIFAGLVTNCCILFSVTGAFFRGFRPIVLHDCCADRTQERHDFVFNTYPYLFRKASLENLNTVINM